MNSQTLLPATDRAEGFTQLEAIAVALLVWVAALATASFCEVLEHKRIDEIADDLVDLEYARSEASQRNEIVRAAFGPGRVRTGSPNDSVTGCLTCPA